LTNFTREKILTELKIILARIIHVDNDSLEESYVLIGNENWDSLSQMEVILGVEAQFEIEFPLEKLSSSKTVADLVGAVYGALPDN
jgi:acyl carrier protein